MKRSIQYQVLEQKEESDNEDYKNDDKEEEKEEKEKKSIVVSECTTRGMRCVVAACLVNSLANSVMSLIVPYFPIVAVRMGVSKSVIGLIVGLPPFVAACISLFTGKLLQIFGSKRLLIGALAMAGLSQAVFGLGITLPNNVSFVVFSLSSRTLTFIGIHISYTLMLVFLGQEFDAKLAFVLAVCQIFSGLGLSGAPALGGAIYQVGGYIVPTLTVGLMIIASAVFILILFWNVEFKDSKTTTELLSSTLRLSKIPRVLIAVQCSFLCHILQTVLESIFAIFGKEVLHLDEWQIGLVYSPLWLSYLPASLFVGYIVDIMRLYLPFIAWGFLASAFGFFFLGPAPFLAGIFPVGTIWLTVVAEVFIGLGISHMYIPLLPYIFNSLRDEGMEPDLTTNSILAGIFVFANQAGCFTGPLLAGVIADYVDIRADFTIFGFVLVAQVGMLTTFGLYRSCFKRSNTC